MKKFSLWQGDNLEIMKTFKSESVDSIVTDPPYGFRFMGKKWDYMVPSVEQWEQCLRILKPGGYLLSFCGARTQHRMAVNIEDAGFEIRDMMAWVYGSGFPKSMDVSKAIDKIDASEKRVGMQTEFTKWMRDLKPNRTAIKKCLVDAGLITSKSNLVGHFFEFSQPQIPSVEMYETFKHLIPTPPDHIMGLIINRTVESENFKNRPVVGTKKGVDTKKQSIACAINAQGLKESTRTEFNITAPATAAGQEWEGWGTALKPALEPITMARKPFRGTVASNVLEWGTGSINIDACRIPTDETIRFGDGTMGDGVRYRPQRKELMKPGKQNPLGRFPANLIHDGSPEVLDIFPGSGEKSAARYFYCPKATKADRGDYNNHPTVKPTNLMRYLVRLVTPPGGGVVDPFVGSGSTGKASILEGFRFAGIDIDPEAISTANRRIVEALESVA